MSMSKNSLRAGLAAIVTGAALLAPAASAGAAATDLPCGQYTSGGYEYYRNCEDHAVKAQAQYWDGWHSWACVQPGQSELFGSDVWLIIKIEDHC
ncbi:DUF6355 family natural product biosynthesis protein [Kitasatospora sp. NPDC015120]|uniref:DUF6355 family natural product biosynthesis protein n=1 Tax=Kitasatospora sp. NPDC015120 TaxID=3364023 RepID=UPI0036F4A4A3